MIFLKIKTINTIDQINNTISKGSAKIIKVIGKKSTEISPQPKSLHLPNSSKVAFLSLSMKRLSCMCIWLRCLVLVRISDSFFQYFTNGIIIIKNMNNRIGKNIIKQNKMNILQNAAQRLSCSEVVNILPAQGVKFCGL